MPEGNFKKLVFQNSKDEVGRLLEVAKNSALHRGEDITIKKSNEPKKITIPITMSPPEGDENNELLDEDTKGKRVDLTTVEPVACVESIHICIENVDDADDNSVVNPTFIQE